MIRSMNGPKGPIPLNSNEEEKKNEKDEKSQDGRTETGRQKKEHKHRLSRNT